jgi:H+-translocating NAD(P) transhydrogenase subunit alpha
MKIGAPKETFEAEARVAMTPDSALQLQKIGFLCSKVRKATRSCQGKG